MPSENLHLDRTRWRVRNGWVTLPYKDLRKIGANRARWIAFGKAKALAMEETRAGSDD